MEIVFSDNYLESVIKYVIESAPFGKVAVFIGQADAVSSLQPITDSLKRCGNKVVNFIFSDDFDFSVEKICGIFNMHEDIRLILCMDEKFSNTASYVALLKNIFLICVAKADSDRFLQKEFFVKNGDVFDKIKDESKKIIIFEGGKNVEQYKWLEFIAHQKFALFNHYARCVFFGGNLDCVAVRGILEQLNRAESCIDFDLRTELSQDFFQALSNIYNLNCATQDKIFDGAPANVAEQISRNHFDSATKFQIDCSVMSALKKSLKTAEFVPPDYNAIAEVVSKSLNVKRSFVADDILKVLKNMRIANEKEFNQFLEALSTTDEYLKNVRKKIKNERLNTVKLSSDVKRAVSISGDTFFGVNLLTLAREMPFI